MTYHELQKLKKQSLFSEDDYYHRISSHSSIQTEFLIHSKTDETYPIFFNLLPRITYLVSQMYKNSSKLAVHLTQLSLLEQEELLDYLFIEEMMATNQLANHSLKRKNISIILQKLKEKKQIEDGLEYLYYALINSLEINLPINELDHNIMKFVDSQNDEILQVLKILLAHYLLVTDQCSLESQQTARFIFSYQLSQELDILSTLSISQAILKDDALYQKAFNSLNEPNNYGEATFFLIYLLELLLNQQKVLINLLERNSTLRNKIEKQLQNELQKTPFAFDVFEVYFDRALYYPNESLSRKNILSFAHKNISPYMMRKIEALLLDMELIEKRGEKPVTYRLNPKIISNMDPPI